MGVLCKNILVNRKIYSDLLNLKQSNTISDKQIKYQNSIDTILLLLDDVKLFIENISCTSNNISVDIRIGDKKYIYNIVDNLRQSNLDIKSYGYISENDGLYLYKIDIGV